MVLPFAAALLLLSGASASPAHPAHRRGLAGERSLGWKLQTTYQGDNFYSTWNWETFDDPTNGRTNYVNLDEAKAKGLTWVDEKGRFGMKADHWSTIDRNNTSVRGRDSIRIQSHERYFDSLIVLDIQHMPVGCGTWPAFWTIGTGDWPTGGEIDIIEGTNDQGNNQYTVHTTTDCKIPTKNNDDTSGHNEPYSGDARALECTPGPGCSIDGADPTTFGPGMNSADGGYLLTRIDQKKGVSFWWYPRKKGGIPQAVLEGRESIDEQDLGMRVAHFPASETCDMDKSLTEQQLIFNIAMCGGWCASRYPHAEQCQKKYPGKQWEDIIDLHPEEFKDAYWLINSLKVYQPCAECGSDIKGTLPSGSASVSPSSTEGVPSPSASASASSETSSASASATPSPESSSASPSPEPSSASKSPSSVAESSSASPSPTAEPSSSEAPEPSRTATESEGGYEGGWTSAWTSSTAWTSATAWTSTWTVPAAQWTEIAGLPLKQKEKGDCDVACDEPQFAKQIEHNGSTSFERILQAIEAAERKAHAELEKWRQEYKWDDHGMANGKWKGSIEQKPSGAWSWWTSFWQG